MTGNVLIYKHKHTVDQPLSEELNLCSYATLFPSPVASLFCKWWFLSTQQLVNVVFCLYYIYIDVCKTCNDVIQLQHWMLLLLGVKLIWIDGGILLKHNLPIIENNITNTLYIANTSVSMHMYHYVF